MLFKDTLDNIIDHILIKEAIVEYRINEIQCERFKASFNRHYIVVVSYEKGMNKNTSVYTKEQFINKYAPIIEKDPFCFHIFTEPRNNVIYFKKDVDK